MINLASEVEYILSTLQKNGYSAYIIGGCVRDFLMNKTAKDYDVTTNALPEDIKNCFSSHTCVDTGIKHGTVTVIIDDIPIEITTYRTDGKYSDHRHPESVSFSSSLLEDTSRRDFTMNAIAYQSKEGFIDYHGGISDIQNKTIRCIGDPDIRFSEDALRILRAIRFFSSLGFIIEKDTEASLFKNKDLLNHISKERIYSEFVKILCGKFAGEAIVKYIDILSVFIDELSLMKDFNQKNPHHIYDLLRHTALVVDNIEPIAELRLAAFFHDIGKPYCFSLDQYNIGHFYGHSKKSAELCEKILLNLKADSKTRLTVTTLVFHHDAPISPEEKIIKRKLNKLSKEIFFKLIKLQRADNLGLDPKYKFRQKIYDELETLARIIIEQEECFSLKNLAINGNNLLELGYKGKEIGETLNWILSLVIDGEIENEKESILSFLNRAKSYE